MNGEKIDVVEWSTDTGKFIANSLSPAKVMHVRLAEDVNGDKVANVIVDEKMLSLAIGKEGQNARLAAKLTGWRIDIKSDVQVAEDVKLKADAEAARIAALTPEEILAEQVGFVAPVKVEPVEPLAVEPAVVEPVAQVEPAPVETVAPVVAQAPIETPPTAAQAEAAVPVVEGELPAGEAPVEGEQTFEQAWEEFEAEEGDELLTPEEMLKRKADRRKRQTLVFDETLGKVVAKRKRKGGRAKDWQDQVEE